MRTPGHIAGGWLITRLLARKGWLGSAADTKHLLRSGAIYGAIPDADYLLFVIQKRGFAYGTDFRHHTWITHTFPFYLSIALLIYGYGLIRKNQRTRRQAIVFFAATAVHLLQDMIGSGDGIMLCYPFSKKMHGIALSGLHGLEWDRHYSNSRIYWVELSIITVAMVTYVYDRYVKKCFVIPKAD